MKNDSQVIFITHPYFAVNNPSNNLRLYTKVKNSDHWTYVQCKDKDEYREKLQNYVLGYYGYARDEKKAHTTVKEYLKEDETSVFDYFMGSKKTEQVMKENQMKREEMAMYKNGNFLKDNDIPNLKKMWCKYIENSNVHLSVLSFNQSYVDENLDIKELQKIITTNVMPKFLSYCGYEDPRNNLDWVVSLHSDREGNYHFHIAFVEKNKCYRNKNNELVNRKKLLLSDKETNFIKRESALAIERKKIYTPALIELEKDFDELKKYFNPKDQNFTLKNIKTIDLEEKIVKLGFLVNQIRDTSKRYIKFNSLPNNEIGKEIRKLAKEIRKEFLKDKDITVVKSDIAKSIEKINDILLDIDKRNNISEDGFESAVDNKMIKAKLEKSDNYILNAIVNHALYNFEYHKRRIKKNNLTVEDIISQVAYDNYVREYKDKKIQKIRKVKYNIIKNTLSGKTCKNKFLKALDRLGYEQDKIAEQFYEMFEESEKNI